MLEMRGYTSFLPHASSKERAILVGLLTIVSHGISLLYTRSLWHHASFLVLLVNRLEGVVLQ